MTDKPRHRPDIATVIALMLWLGVGSVALVLTGRALAGAFDAPVGPALPVVTTTAALLASLSAWTLFHRDQHRGDVARRVWDGFLALAPVAMIAFATAVNASAMVLAVLSGLLICGLAWVVGYEGVRQQLHHGLGSDETAQTSSAAAFIDESSIDEGPLPIGGDRSIDVAGQPLHEHLQRRTLPGGGTEIEAVLIARFLPGQRLAAIHLPIHPLLPQAPHVECEPLDDSPVSLQVTSTHGYGVRVEVKRTTAIEAEAAVPIGLLLTTADSGASAA